MTLAQSKDRPTTLGRLATFCCTHRYSLLGVAIVVGTAIQALNEQWSSDVFEHLAVIRELSARPFDPSHPILPVGTTHPFYSPYTVVLGLIGQATGWTPVTLLKLATVGNAVLLVVAYRRFVTTVTQQRNAEFYGLLAVLLLWGPTAWRLSGLLNLGSIGFGMAYPSAFATALMLFVLAEVDLMLREGARASRFVLVALMLATILLTHPITGIATVTGIAGVWIGRGRVLPSSADVPLLGTLMVALMLVTLWPYYSFWRLLVDGGDYTDSHRYLYEGLYLRVAPLLVLAILLAVRRPNLRTDPVLTWAVLGVGLYLTGAVTGQYVLGRTVSFIALAVFTAVGVVVARYFEQSRPGVDRVLVVTTGVLAVVGLVFASPALLRIVPRTVLPGHLRAEERLEPATDQGSFLVGVIPPDAVVAAFPNDLSDAAPAFAGKVVSTPKPMPFVDDEVERAAGVRRLFSDRASAALRQETAADYGVEYLVYDERAVARQADAELRRLGTVAYDRDHVVVVSVAR